MYQSQYPADQVHDFLFLDTVQRAHDHGLTFDYHLRPASAAEVEQGLYEFIKADLAHHEHTLTTNIPSFGDRWLHTSNMQKAIRRGNFKQAWRSANWLIEHEFEDKMWTRLSVIAAEDIAFGDPYLTAIAVYATRSKTTRNKLGPKLLSWLLTQMCRPDMPKSRDLTDPFVSSLADGNPIQQVYEASIGRDPVEIISRIADDGNPFNERMGLLWNFYPRELIIEGKKYTDGLTAEHRETLIEVMRMPGLISYLFHWTRTATGYGLNVPVPLVWERLCQATKASADLDPYHPTMIPGNPDEIAAFVHLGANADFLLAAAVDQHTHYGRKAIGYWLKASPAMAEHALQPLATFTGAVKEALFYAEVGLLGPRLHYDNSDAAFKGFRNQYFFDNYQLEPDQVTGLIHDVARDLRQLIKARKKVLSL